MNARCGATFFAWLSRTSDQIMLVDEMYLLIYSGLSMKGEKIKEVKMIKYEEHFKGIFRQYKMKYTYVDWSCNQ